MSSSIQPESTSALSITQQSTPVPDKINFTCAICSLHEKCDYYGRSPPFLKKIEFREDCFIMKDPFSPHSKTPSLENFLIIGSNCAICDKTICRDSDCSYYYFKTFCLECALNRINEFPLEIQSKIRRAISNYSNS